MDWLEEGGRGAAARGAAKERRCSLGFHGSAGECVCSRKDWYALVFPRLLQVQG